MKRFLGTFLLGGFFYILICGFVFPLRQPVPVSGFPGTFPESKPVLNFEEDFSRPEPLETFMSSILSADLFSRSV